MTTFMSGYILISLFFNCDKIFIIPFEPFVSVQFSGIKYIRVL